LKSSLQPWGYPPVAFCTFSPCLCSLMITFFPLAFFGLIRLN
jgi:hypothetical protein